MLEAPIRLTHEEATVLKNEIFRNFTAELDPNYKRAANKEIISVNKAV